MFDTLYNGKIKSHDPSFPRYQYVKRKQLYKFSQNTLTEGSKSAFVMYEV